MDSSISDMFSTSDIFNTSNITINNDFDHLRIIFEEVLCTISFIDVEENLFNEEVPKLKHACNEVLDQIQDHLKNIQSNKELLEAVKQLIQRYISLLNFTHTAVKYISSKVLFSQVKSLPLAVCEILIQALKHCRESDKLYGNNFVSVSYLLTDLFKKASELQSSFLVLLNNNLIFDLNKEDQIVFLVQVAENLNEIGQIVSGLDIKTTAELWKSYLEFLQKHNDHMKTRMNIEPSIKYLCSEIINSLDSTGAMLDMKNVGKPVKISSFNLKIIIKLCNLFDYFGESIESLFNLLVTLNRYSTPCLQFQKSKQKFIDLMQIYITVASEPLLNCLIGNREFIQHYFKNIKNVFEDDAKKLASIFLTISIMKKLLSSDEDIKKQWMSCDKVNNIIFSIFSSFPHFHDQLSLDYPIQHQESNGEPAKIISLYEFIYIHLTSLIITLKLKQFKVIQNLLFTSIIQSDLWTALISSDIWVELGRHGSAEFCFESLKFLINVYIKVQNCNRPEIINLRCVIRRNFCLLSDKYKIDLFNQYPCNEYLKVWTVIGIQNEQLLINNLQHFIDQAIQKIDTFFETKSMPSFKSMTEILDLLSTHTFSEPNEVEISNLVSCTIKLWSLNADQSWFLKFFDVRTKLTSLLISNFSNEELLMILQSLKELNSDNSKISQCIILNSLSDNEICYSKEQNDIFDIISTLFNSVLKDGNPIVKQCAIENFKNFAYRTAHQEILANTFEDNSKMQEEITNYFQKITQGSNQSDYFRAQSKVHYQHKCRENFRSSEPVQKKKKLDSDVNVLGMIQTIKYNCDSLIDYYKNKKVSDDVSAELNEISSSLQTLLNK